MHTTVILRTGGREEYRKFADGLPTLCPKNRVDPQFWITRAFRFRAELKTLQFSMFFSLAFLGHFPSWETIYAKFPRLSGAQLEQGACTREGWSEFCAHLYRGRSLSNVPTFIPIFEGPFSHVSSRFCVFCN